MIKEYKCIKEYKLNSNVIIKQGVILFRYNNDKFVVYPMDDVKRSVLDESFIVFNYDHFQPVTEPIKHNRSQHKKKITQIKIFNNENEDYINTWLRDNNVDVISISTTQTYNSKNDLLILTVLILYKI